MRYSPFFFLKPNKKTVEFCFTKLAKRKKNVKFVVLLRSQYPARD